MNRNKDAKKHNVPCDLLLLSGQAVVNEAILTGESQPLVKESIEAIQELRQKAKAKGVHPKTADDDITEDLRRRH